MKAPTLDDQYFYVLPDDIDGREKLVLRGEEAHHCTKVLRKTPGSRFFAVDGLGNEYVVELMAVIKDIASCNIVNVKTRPTELSINITLAQALIKKDHFDLVVEKSTELGVNQIIPVETDRSIPEPGKNKLQRWQKIIVSSMKQSRRSVLPHLSDILRLEKLLENSAGYDTKVIFHEKSDRQVMEFISGLPVRSSKILILIGPEGGFTESEHAMAVNQGFISLSLGQRRLRAETAAICAVSIFSNLYPPQNT